MRVRQVDHLTPGKVEHHELPPPRKLKDFRQKKTSGVFGVDPSTSNRAPLTQAPLEMGEPSNVGLPSGKVKNIRLIHNQSLKQQDPVKITTNNSSKLIIPS